MRIKTPKLPAPRTIRTEIAALKARIGELKTLLPLAEIQHLRKPHQSEAAQNAVTR